MIEPGFVLVGPDLTIAKSGAPAFGAGLKTNNLLSPGLPTTCSVEPVKRCAPAASRIRNSTKPGLLSVSLMLNEYDQLPELTGAFNVGPDVISTFADGVNE